MNILAIDRSTDTQSAAVAIDGKVHSKEVPFRGPMCKLQVGLTDVDFWWPRGMGEPALYDAKIELVADDGKVLAVDTPDKLFADEERLKQMDIAQPALFAFAGKVKAELKRVIPGAVFDLPKKTAEEEAEAILRGCATASRTKASEGGEHA